MRSLFAVDNLSGKFSVNAGRNADQPCEKTYCAWGATCVVSENGKALCQCPTNCPSNSAQVCGSDDVTYTNQCHLRQASCQRRKNTRIKHEGACGVEETSYENGNRRKFQFELPSIYENSRDTPKDDVALLAVITTGRPPRFSFFKLCETLGRFSRQNYEQHRHRTAVAAEWWTSW
ncbi:hypothetical protein HZH68_006472 [Vespula germanica]|uniref:Kazal-like domain-containing protein n=1 Tax=Vespula germanica TaxID=30212 RepID=A0A834KBK3_VESGE|nr:hypothetical protein HZH68_006472 [Vespula germanica]